MKYNNKPKYKYEVCINFGKDAYGKDIIGHRDNYHMYPNCNPEYVLFDHTDPDGSNAHIEHEQKLKTERIKTLKESIQTMQKELDELESEN